MASKVFLGEEITEAIKEGQKEFEDYIIEGNVKVIGMELTGNLNFTDVILRGDLDIENAKLEKLTTTNAQIDATFATNTAIENLVMGYLQTEMIELNNTHIYDVWDLEEADIAENIILDEKTKFNKIFLRGAKYKYFFTNNLHLAITAKLSREGIIIPANQKNLIG